MMRMNTTRNTEGNKITPLAYTGTFLLACFVVLFVYDYTKDIIRIFSGYMNILNGDEVQGAIKVMGYTRPNVIRGILMFALLVGAGGCLYFAHKDEQRRNTN